MVLLEMFIEALKAVDKPLQVVNCVYMCFLCVYVSVFVCVKLCIVVYTYVCVSVSMPLFVYMCYLYIH